MVIETVVFDLDGVLCTLEHPARLAYLSSVSGMPPDAIHRAIWESGFEDQSDAGALSADDYLSGFGQRIGYALSEQEWVAARRAASRPFAETLAIAQALSGRVRLALLTNNGLQLKRTLPDVLPSVASLFGERAYVSAEFGVCKPDPEVYRRLCSSLGAQMKSTLMIDDRPENIEGARSAGLMGFEFQSADALDQELRRLGLL